MATVLPVLVEVVEDTAVKEVLHCGHLMFLLRYLPGAFARYPQLGQSNVKLSSSAVCKARIEAVLPLGVDDCSSGCAICVALQPGHLIAIPPYLTEFCPVVTLLAMETEFTVSRQHVHLDLVFVRRQF